MTSNSKWLVFGAVSFAFFLLNLSTFTSLGVVLYPMVNDLHWSLTEAGLSFTVLGLACGLSSPLPALTVRWWGGRMTLFVGCALLVLGFALASISQNIMVFYTAMLLLGFGYALAGNVPGVYLLAGWFEARTSRIVGFYLMFGALGAAFGPPIVQAILSSDGWRMHWRIMAGVSALTAVMCLLFVRDARVAVNSAEPLTPGQALTDWSVRDAIFTWQFALAAAAMTMTMACVTTYSSVMVTHLVNFGTTPGGAALILSVMAITATVMKGAAGRLCESVASAHVLSGGLVMQAVGSALLAHAGVSWMQYTGAVAFGIGWGFSYVAGTVVLLDYFGGIVGSKILSIVWLLSSAAAAGPLAAGMIADSFGTFAPIFQIYAALLVILSVPIFLMRVPPHRTRSVPLYAPPLGNE